MQTSQEIDQVAGALSKVQGKAGMVAKSGTNTFDRYSYAALDDYVKVIKPLLEDAGLSVITSVRKVKSLPDRTTAQGKTERAVRVVLTIRVMHTSGQWIEVEAWGEGQDRADKAIYKAKTGGRKYGLASLFGLATSDDPERDNRKPPKQEDDPPPPQRPAFEPLTDAQVTEVVNALGERGIPLQDFGAFLVEKGVPVNVSKDTGAPDLSMLPSKWFSRMLETARTMEAPQLGQEPQAAPENGEKPPESKTPAVRVRQIAGMVREAQGVDRGDPGILPVVCKILRAEGVSIPDDIARLEDIVVGPKDARGIMGRLRRDFDLTTGDRLPPKDGPPAEFSTPGPTNAESEHLAQHGEGGAT